MSHHDSPHTPKRTSRVQARLSERLDKHLNAYTIAAGAAGVGILALAQPAEGKIIFTPTRQTIAPNTTVNIDLNKDGITDFAISNHYFIGTPTYQGYQGQVRVFGMNATNEIVGTSFESASALTAGAKIGAKDKFRGLEMVSCKADEHSGGYRFGQWINAKNLFLGFSFKINGQTHFGWARISLKQLTFCQATGVLTGYAYETVVNKPIIAGQTSGTDEVSGANSSSSLNSGPTFPDSPGLGSLALGTPGITIWRREDPKKIGR